MSLSPYYGSNYLGLNTGATAFIGADPIIDPAGYTYYVQYYKTVFGASGSFNAVSASNPFPVTVTNGLTATIAGITGTVTIQGTPSGTAVPVSGSVVVTGITASPVPVYTPPGCRVEVTGGRYLNKLTDNVSIFGPSGNTWIYSNIVNASGVAIGTTANPMQVSFSGVTITANIGAVIGVTNDPATVTDPGHSHYVGNTPEGWSSSGNIGIVNRTPQNVQTSTAYTGISVATHVGVTIDTTGNGVSHNNIQPVLAAYYIMYIPS
jgi:hypothetical protein